ncbi:MAG: hypothetical protein IT323_22945 [Anaerolineae bacterium]|nr:hypothetical protein [Anaerolineae bacterium]
MTLPFVCEDCGEPMLMERTCEWLAIYEHRIALCWFCQASIAEDAEAYRRMDEAEGRVCKFFERNGVTV